MGAVGESEGGSLQNTVCLYTFDLEEREREGVRERQGVRERERVRGRERDIG